MIAEPLNLYQEQLESMAQAWLSCGATSFSVWLDGTTVYCWPSDHDGQDVSLAAEFMVEKERPGELRLTGLQDSAAGERLKIEAELLTKIIPLERELNFLAGELVDARDQLLALYDLTRETRNTLDIETLLDHIAFESLKLIKAEYSFIVLRMEGEFPRFVFHPRPFADEEYLLSLTQQLQMQEDPFLSLRRERLDSPDIQNILLVSIPVRDAKSAVLGVINKQGCDEFMSPDIKLARVIAEFASAQIENRLMVQSSLELTRLQTEMELARRVQLSLLPQKPPPIAGIDLWAASYPASHVGGDFYDFICKYDQPVTFVVGDISGKGMPAALLMTMVRTVIRKAAGSISLPKPSVIVSQSNAELYEDFTEASMFATLFLAQFDPETREFTFANAGHSPVIYIPAGGHPVLLQADGTPMGVLPTSLSRDHCMPLQQGDVLLVGTDGLNDARNKADERFGYDRLLALGEQLAHQPAHTIANQIIRSVRAFSLGETQEDDQTLVVLKCTG